MCIRDRLIPAGPLRESVDSLKSAHIIIINGDQNIEFERKLLEINNEISIFYSRYQLIDIEKYRGKKLFVVAGIGNPENFFELIRNQNLNIIKKLSFPDHYQFSKSEILNIINDHFKVKPVERDIDRSELSLADEAFFCGTAWEVTPILSIDRSNIGTGMVGNMTKSIQQKFFSICDGTDDCYPEWRYAVYSNETRKAAE